MSSIKIDVQEFTLPSGTDSASFPLEIPGLTPASAGWVWYRSKPTWFEPQVLSSLGSLLNYSIHLMCVQGDDYMCILPVSSATALSHLRRSKSDKGKGKATEEATEGIVHSVKSNGDTEPNGKSTQATQPNATHGTTDQLTDQTTDQTTDKPTDNLDGKKIHNPGDKQTDNPASSTDDLNNQPNHPLILNVRRASHEEARAAVIIVRTPDATKIASLPGVAISRARQWVSPTTVYADPKFAFDGLGFCTYSSLGEGNRPTEKTLGKLVEDLVVSEIPVQAFIIDDGWQNTRTYDRSGGRKARRHGLWDFNAHPDLGPGGLPAAVGMIKHKLGTLPTGPFRVGVWVALTGGYWEGIHPDSPLIPKYDCKPYTASIDWWDGVANATHDVPYLPNGKAEYYLPSPDKALAFWKDYFLHLADAGVVFVKVDNQATMTSLSGVDGAIEARVIWQGMYDAAEQVFGGKAIHCMAHGENMWTGVQGLGVASSGERIVWRNSDDFGLSKPTAHQDHFFTNIFNSLVSNALCVIPDADMFMTAAQAPHSHALLRAFFPGPLTLSDKPKEHDLSLLARLMATDKSGNRRAIRTKVAPEPLARRMLDSTIRDHSTGTGLWATVRGPKVTLIGVWNVRGNGCRVLDKITIDDIEDAVGHTLVHHHAVVRVNVIDHGLHSASLIRPDQHGELGRIELPPLASTAYWITQVYSLGVGPVTVLGLIDAYAGPMAIGEVEHTINRVDVLVRFAGVLGLLVAAPLRPAATALVDGRPEIARVSRLLRLDGKEQNLFLLKIKVGGRGVYCDDDDREEERLDGWKVRISIE